MDDSNRRKAIVERALYGCAILIQIAWEGDAHTFTVRLVGLLDKFSECAPGSAIMSARGPSFVSAIIPRTVAQHRFSGGVWGASPFSLISVWGGARSASPSAPKAHQNFEILMRFHPLPGWGFRVPFRRLTAVTEYSYPG